ncbi:hypothetical protein HDU67_000088 [Dinochytrium kinnereticum]|nr:hypothetical protein HDU67_000088 [Dinochytrium kinnereticum]
MNFVLARAGKAGRHAWTIHGKLATGSTSALRRLGAIRHNATATSAQRFPDLLNGLIDLQTELGESSRDWVNRVATASRDLEDVKSPFLITVVGEHGSNKESLIDSLINISASTSVAGDYFGYEQSKILRISYGDKTSKPPTVEPSADTLRIQAPVEWLNSYQVEIASCTPEAKEADDVLYNSDLLVLVTDAVRPLSTPSEVRLLERFHARGKRNVVIAVNNIDYLEGSSASVDSVLSHIQRRVAEIIGSESAEPTETVIGAIPIYPISSRKARSLQVSFANQGRRTDGPDFTSHWNASGVQDLKTTILARVSSQSRSEHRVEAVRFKAAEALRRILADQEASLDLLASTQSRIQSVLVPGLVAGEERLHEDFEKRELVAVNENLAQLTDSLRDYFGRVGIAKLIFKSDVLAKDVKSTMRSNSLLKAEYQVAIQPEKSLTSET